jgi:lysophospholipase
MFGIRPALPDSIANLLLWMSNRRSERRGKAADFFFGQSDYNPVPFSANKLTHSQVRYHWFRRLYDESPEIQLGGVTGQWLSAARTAMQVIHEQADQIRLPALLLSAGADKVVDNAAQQVVAAKMPHCSFTQIPGAEHELLIESDEYRRPTMESILRFFYAHL